jgi:hypothetical protein
MASLTDTLPTERSGKETMQPVQRGPSIFEGLVEVANVVTSSLEGAADTRARREQKRRQAEADAAAADKANAENAAAESKLRIASYQPGPVATENFGQLPPPVDSELQGLSTNETKAVSAAGTIIEKGQVMQQAVSQGRMTAQTYELMIESELRRLFSLYPNQKAVIFAAFDKSSIDHPIFSEYRELLKAEEANATAQTERENKAIEAAVQGVGLDANVKSREELIAAGNKYLATKAQNAAAQAEAEEERARWRFDKEKLNAVNEASSKGFLTEYRQTYGIIIAAGTQEIRKIVNNTELSDPEKLKQIGPLINQYRATGQAQIRELLMIGQGNGMTQEDLNFLEKSLTTDLDQVLEEFNPNNPVNVLQRNAKAYEMMVDQSKLRMEEAIPLFNSLKRTFGEGPELDAIVEQFFSDPKLGTAIAREMQGFAGLDEQQKTVRLKNAIAAITDSNTQFKDFATPEAAQQSLKDSAEYRKRILPSALSGTNARAEELGLNITGKIANAGVEVGVGADTSTLLNVSDLLANDDTYRLIKQSARRPENEDFANLAADSSRAAVQKNLIALRQKGLTMSPYHKVVYDIGARQFIVQRTDKRIPDLPVEHGFGPSTPVPGQPTAFQPTEQMLKVKDALNKDLKFLEATTSFEDDMPLNTVSLVERAKFYVTGEIPDKLKPKPEEKAPSTREIISKLEKQFADARVQFEDIDVTTREEVIERETGESVPRAERVVNYEAREKTGISHIPQEIQTLGELVQWGKSLNNSGVDSSATGLYQITQSTYEEFGEKALGPNWRDKPITRANQDKVAREIFHDAKALGAAALKKRWVSLTMDEARELVKGTWEQARGLIAQKESGG